MHVLGGAEHDRLAELERSIDIAQHQRGRAVGNRRTIGALERTGDARVLLAFLAAEGVPEILAQLRVWVADAVPVVLGGDACQRVGLVAPALEIAVGDLAEKAGEAAVDVGFFTHIGRLEQIAPYLGGRRRGHLLDADHEHDARRSCGDGFQSLVHGGGAGRARVLDPCRALEAQIGCGLQHERCGKILRREAGVEVPEDDLVDVLCRDTGVEQRLVCHAYHKALDRFAGELPEGRMCPSHDASRH